MVCDCLERIFSSGKGFDILIRPEVKPFILQGIIHSEENTRKMTLKQLKLHFGSESIAERFQHLVRLNALAFWTDLRCFVSIMANFIKPFRNV